MRAGDGAEPSGEDTVGLGLLLGVPGPLRASEAGSARVTRCCSLGDLSPVGAAPAPGLE